MRFFQNKIQKDLVIVIATRTVVHGISVHDVHMFSVNVYWTNCRAITKARIYIDTGMTSINIYFFVQLELSVYVCVLCCTHTT